MSSTLIIMFIMPILIMIIPKIHGPSTVPYLCQAPPYAYSHPNLMSASAPFKSQSHCHLQPHLNAHSQLQSHPLRNPNAMSTPMFLTSSCPSPIVAFRFSTKYIFKPWYNGIFLMINDILDLCLTSSLSSVNYVRRHIFRTMNLSTASIRWVKSSKRSTKGAKLKNNKTKIIQRYKNIKN